MLVLLPLLAIGQEEDGGINTTSSDDPRGENISLVKSNNLNLTGGDVTNQESNFFAFSTAFPQATGCFGGAQGGGSSSGGGAFLGFHRLNTDCWLDSLAEAESSVDLRARLKCGAKKFRDAVAYDQKKDKQAFCVDYVIKVWKAEIAREQAVAKSCETATCSFVNGVLSLEPSD